MADMKAIKSVVLIGFLTLILMVPFITGNPSAATLLMVYIVMLIVSIYVYSSKTFKDGAIGIRRDNIFKCIILAGIIAAGFYVLAKATGLSIGLPNLPNSLAEEFRNFIVLVFAPITETLFYQGAAFAVFLSIFGRKWYALLAQALFFSVSHVVAYIQGWYSYPTFAVGLEAFSKNLGSFVAAFLFASIAMYITLAPKIKSLTFAIVFHFFMNLIITILLTLVIIH